MPLLVSITGVGLVTPLGDSARHTWGALLAGEFITDHTPLKSKASYTEGILPAVPIGRAGRMPAVRFTEPRVSCAAIDAAAEAVADARWNKRSSTRTALVVGTSKGPVESWIAGGTVDAGLSAVASAIRSSMPDMQLSPTVTLSAACASGLHALIRATLMLQNGEADRALVVAAEASVHPMFLSSFKRLGVLASPAVGCRPFDENREGFLMSEAAAAVCLEEDPGHGYAVIDRMAFGADATHLTGSDPKAVTLRRLLRRVIDQREIDLIHGHGTGTVVNDAIELDAIETAINEQSRMPNLYSHKGAIGHSLGAAGLAAVVINAMAHRHSIVPPNVRTTQPMACRRLVIEQVTRRAVRRSAVIAAGFGGAVAAVTMNHPV